jgi:hypothetical protein
MRPISLTQFGQCPVSTTAEVQRRPINPRALIAHWSEVLGVRDPAQDVCGAGLMGEGTAPSRLAERAVSKARLTGGGTLSHDPGGIGVLMGQRLP